MSQKANMWSARKAAVKAEAEAEVEAIEAAVVAREQEALAEKSDEEILQELELQNPDDMVAGDDFAAFMKAAVPEHLRKRALRKLWLSDPALANLDNLLDYGDDFAAEAKLGAVIKTAYQVGKGFLRDLDEIAEQSGEPEQVEDVATEPEENRAELGAVENPPEGELDEIMDTVQKSGTITFNDVPDEFADDEPMIAVKRRMRFEFAADDARPMGKGIG